MNRERFADPQSSGDRKSTKSGRSRSTDCSSELKDLLCRSLDAGATLVAIGPYTNLALLEITRVGSLGMQPVVVMGGWVQPPAPGLPQWGPDMDFSVQCDTRPPR